MTRKKEFMLLFRFEPNNSYQPTETEMDELQQQWGTFIGKIALQEKLVSTHQLGFEGVNISANKSTKKGIHIANKQILGGNMIVSANTIKEAAGIAKDCPILLIGGTVEVRSIQTM